MYDLLIAFETLEHVYNPGNFLKKIYQILRKGGRIYFTIPNFIAYDFFEAGAKYNNLFGPSHLNYFNPYAIKLLLKSLGYKKIQVYSDGILDVDIIKNYYINKKIRMTGFWKYIFDNSDKYNEFMLDFQGILRKHLLSGNITVTAEK